MADNLSEEWWQTAVSDEEEGASDDGERKEMKRKLNEPTSGIVVSENEEPEVKKKKRRNRKRITEAKLPDQGDSPTMLRDYLKLHFSKLSKLEFEDISLTESNFTACNIDKEHTTTSYFKQIAPKWHRLSTAHSHKMSPLIIVVCGNALRASKFNTEAKTFKGKDARSIKLFARHMKIDDQIKLLRENVIHFAVGTPERIRSLILQDALSLEHTRAFVIDWNWRDVKLKRLIDIREARASLMNLLKDCVIPACKKHHVKIGLF
nr:protein CMSS1-like isoform X1 [Ciona intestinalis]|eukprot:XP_018667799.1 protein CMSS1-like isoform X1 [Ciona intestinalis]